MPYVPGLPTLIKDIKSDPNLTPEEKKNLIADARYFAQDGKLTREEKASVREDQKAFGSPNNGATPSPSPSPSPTPTPEPSPSPAPAPSPSPSPATPQPAPAVSAVPNNPWDTTSTYIAPTGIKQATPDIIVFDDSSVGVEYLTQAFFEEFGGTELINISRSDLIDGDSVSYSAVKNLSIIKQAFNPFNIINITQYQENKTKYGIDLILRGIYEPYFNEDGSLVIEIDNVRVDESIEAQISSSGTMDMI